jgi:hypothetical protein
MTATRGAREEEEEEAEVEVKVEVELVVGVSPPSSSSLVALTADRRFRWPMRHLRVSDDEGDRVECRPRAGEARGPAWRR